MAKETKNITIRLSKEQVDYLEATGYSMNAAVSNLIDKVRAIEKYADRDIQNVFTENEWKYMADSMNAILADGDFRYIAKALIANIEDSNKYDGLGAKWDVNVEGLCWKISDLSSSAIDAIHRRIEAFWDDPEQDIDLWAQY